MSFWWNQRCLYHLFFTICVHHSFCITTDVLNTRFNQTGYQLEHLVSTLFARTHRLVVQMRGNETLAPVFTALLKQGNSRRKTSPCSILVDATLIMIWIGHTICIQPFTAYQIERNEAKLLTFDRLQVIPYRNNHLSMNSSRWNHHPSLSQTENAINFCSLMLIGEELMDSTMTWLEWMPHLRSLDIDTRMLLKITPIINANGTIERFGHSPFRSKFVPLFSVQVDILSFRSYPISVHSHFGP